MSNQAGNIAGYGNHESRDQRLEIQYAC